MTGSHKGEDAMSSTHERATRLTRKPVQREQRPDDDHELGKRRGRSARARIEPQVWPKDLDLPDSAVLPAIREYVGPCTSERYIWNAAYPVHVGRPIWQQDDDQEKDFFPEVHNPRAQRSGLPRIREYVGPCTSARYIWNCEYPAKLERPLWQK
jgi:hypothetical protein